MTIVRKWSGDGLSAGALTTSSAGTGDNAFNHVDAGITIEETGVRSPRVAFPGTAHALTCRWSGIGTLTSWGIRQYFTWASGKPSGSLGVLMGYDSLGAAIFRVELNSTGLVRIRNASAATWSQTSGGLVAGQVYRVEFFGGGGTATLQIFLDEEETPIINQTAAIENLALSEVRFGHHASQTLVGERRDDFAVQDVAAVVGAVDPFTPEPETGIIRKWSGDGLSAGPMTVASVGTGDTAFTTVTEGFTLGTGVTRAPRIKWPETEGAHSLRWDNLGNLETFAIRRYFSIGTVPESSWSLIAGYEDLGVAMFRVDVSGSGLLRLRDASDVLWAATSGKLEPGVKYRVEMIYNWGSCSIRLFKEDYTSILVEGVVDLPDGLLEEVRFGLVNSLTTVLNHYGDDFAVSNEDVWIGPVVDGGAEPTPTILKRWSGDGLAPAALTTASAGPGDTPFTGVTGGPTIVAAPWRGPRILLPDAAQVKRVQWSPLFGSSLEEYAIRWYMTFQGYSPADIYLAQGLEGSAGKWSVRMNSSGMVRFRDDAAAIMRWTGTVPMPLNQQIRFELVVDGTVAVLKMFFGDYDVIIDQITTSLTDFDINAAWFGFSAAVASNGITYDDLAVSSVASAIGPAAAPLPPYTHFIKTAFGWDALDVSIM